MEIGHIVSQCPNKRVMILKDEEIKSKGESDDESMLPSDDASDVEYPVDEELLAARRALSVQTKKDEKIIFHNQYHLNNKACSMLIDWENCTNMARTSLAEKLNLTTLKHLRPYKLQWLTDCGEVKVNK